MLPPTKKIAKKTIGRADLGLRVRVDFKLQMYSRTASLNGELGILEGLEALDCGVGLVLVKLDLDGKTYRFRLEDIEIEKK